MPYYAELDGVSGLAQCASALSLPPDFEIDYDLFILSDGNDDYFSAPFNGRGIGFLSSTISFFDSSQQVYFNYPSTGRPAINDIVNIRFVSSDNGDSTYTILCYMSVNGGAEEQLGVAIGNNVFSQPLSPRPMEWGRRPNTLYRKVGVIRTRYYESGILQNDWDFNQSSGSTAPDLVGSNPATLSGGFSWVFYGGATGVTADVTYTVNTPSVSASAGATVPAQQADIAFYVSSPSVSASATASLPQPVSDIAFTVNTPSVTASASSTIPEGKWLLSFDGTDDYVEADIDTLVQPFSATLDIYITDGANSASRFLSIANASGDYIGIGASSGEWKIYSHGVTPGSAGSIQFNERLTVELAVSSSSASVTVNGVEVYSVTPTETTFLNTLDRLIIGAAPDYTFNSQIDLYGVTISSGGAAVNDYDTSLSGGIGQTLYDSVSSQNGTLNNFPNDNSQWVAYSDSVSADVSFAVGAPSVAVSASATLPGYSATVSFTVGAPSVSVNASATLPNPSADVSYTVSTPGVSASASAALPNPVSDIAFSVSAPSVSVSATATEPNFNSNVAFTVNAPTVSISASATLPQPESAISFTVSPPSVSVVAIVGGIAIIVDEETNINQRVLSNNIKAPILSNNING